MMRNLAPVLILLLMASCTSVKVVYDQRIDFGKYKSFYCLECTDEYSTIAPNIDNEDFREMIRAAVIDELTSKGLEFTEENPNLLVDYKFLIEERIAFVGDPETAYSYWETYKYPTTNVKHRMLMVNLIDAEKQVAVWQGITSSMLESDINIVTKKTKRSINKMFKQYKSID